MPTCHGHELPVLSREIRSRSIKRVTCERNKNAWPLTGLLKGTSPAFQLPTCLLGLSAKRCFAQMSINARAHYQIISPSK